MNWENSETITEKALTDLFRRLCDHLGVAFSANRISPSLADISADRQAETIDVLNVVGKHFGIRFRQMQGPIRDLVNTVSDSGPVLLFSTQHDSDHEVNPVLLLDYISRGNLKAWHEGKDCVGSARWIRSLLQPNDDKHYEWFLIQPLLAAENASRFQFQTGEQTEPLSPWRRLLALLRPEASEIRTIVIFSIAIGVLSLTLPLAVEAIVNTIAFGRYLQPLIVLSLMVMIFLGFRAGLSVAMSVVSEIMQRKLFVRTVEDLSYRLTRVPLSYWRSQHGPELVNRFFDIVTIQKVVSKLLLESLMLALQTIIGLSVLAFYHPFLLGYDIGLLLAMSVIIYLIGRGAVRTATQESKLKYKTAAWLQEIVRHPSTYKFNGGLSYAINRADELAANYVNQRHQHFRILIRQFSFAMVMQVVAATVLLALGGYLVIKGQMTLGQLVAAELIVAVILGSFAKLGKDLESFYDLMASVDKLGELFDLPVDPINKLQLAKQPGAYGISLVDYRLENSGPQYDFELQRGRAYALFGDSELKRGQLLETLVGQIKPASGHVLLDDYRVDAIAAESIQEKISLVRDIEIFEGTVDENLRLGRKNVGSADANDVIDRLGMRQTLAALPEGLATQVRISGYPLAQGETIRLVLARALIVRPGVLFVDGLLDRLSDEDIEVLLPRLASFLGTTTIVISTGRRAIARWADQTLNLAGDEWTLSKFND